MGILNASASIIHIAAPKDGGPVLGWEGAVSVPVGDVELFAKIFVMTLMREGAIGSVGSANAKGGVKVHF